MRKIFFSAFLFLPSLAFADCTWNADHSFYGCNESLSIANSVGRTLPVLADTVRFNPAAIPTVPTPVGVEFTYNSRTEGDKNFQPSLLKGLPSVGIAAVSWTENNFSTPNVQKAIGTYYSSLLSSYNQSTSMGFRLGTSVGFSVGNFARISGGASFGQGRAFGSSSTALGVTADAGVFSLGLAKTKDKVVTGLPGASTTTMSVGLTYLGIYIGHTYMKLEMDGLEKLPPIRIYSIRFAFQSIAFYAAMKRDIFDYTGAQKTYFTGNIQIPISSSLVLAYVYGLYDRAHSVSAQFYF